MKWMLTVAYLLFTFSHLLATPSAVAMASIKASKKPTTAENLEPPKALLIHGSITSVTYVDPGNTVPEHLVEFGFFHSGWTIDEIAEVSQFTTFVDVYYNEIDIMRAARSHGLKVWVQLAPIFFDGYPTYRKRADYLERWEIAKKRLEPFSDIIMAFDPLDEPFHRSKLSNLTLKLYLEEIAQLVKESFPKAKRAITFMNETVRKSKFKKIIPKKYNLFAVNYYVGDNFQQQLVEKLMIKTSHLDVNYYLIPRAFKTSNRGFGSISESQLISQARQAYDFARANPKIIAIYPFVWESIFGNGDYYLGVDNLDRVQEEYRKIGHAISKSR
ncbi:hypothetical protein BTJ40_21990 [Microbulbifer sp. A4B17]|uniref:hypothetical protein n=1 Tax=Microbulbifer sp. A4B17 TaxID=359370 RepID=UPI000D52E04F|nr:hypothetical protein [Microbulbifer sp. A4B17]AWF83269.1 hypothetical protein BTJ40_21990 [Microbulbifer sp. A4B17]